MAKKKETKAAAAEVEKVEVKKEKTVLERLELTGKVKQMKMTIHKATKVNGKVVPGAIMDYLEDHNNGLSNFDEKGMRREFYGFRVTGENHTLLFNEKGGHTKSIHYNKDGSENFISDHIFDKNGFEIESSLIYADGRVMNRTYCTNDEQGSRLVSKTYNAEGKMTGQTLSTHNEDNTHLYDHYNYDEAEVLQHRWVSLYDEEYNIIEKKEYDANGNITKIETPKYKIDHLGKKIPDEPDGNYFLQWYFKDVKEVDSHGNWVKKTIYFKSVAMNIIIRDITYYDDASQKKTLTIPTDILATQAKVDEEREKEYQPVFMNEDQNKWMTEGSVQEQFPVLRYYVLKNKEFPSQYTYSGHDCDAFGLKMLLIEKLGGRIINSYTTDYENSYKTKMIRYTLSFLDGKYLLNAFQIQQRVADLYYIPDFLRQAPEYDYNYVHTSQLSMFHPSNDSGKRDLKFEEEIKDLIEMCKLHEKPEKPQIYMVQVNSNGGYSLEGHDVNEDFEIKDLSLNYGHGFEDFHDELMDRFENENKGLVLFHGEPGTGKTFYIRHLLRSMANKNKIVIYMPPNMVDYMVEPQFMSFISREVQQFSQEDNFCVLLIEDAEPLLASRSSDTRIQGVSNLLNMTDGLLNDMLNLQIICTFNVKVSKLDKALLRPGRLLARKEFKALPEFEANLLASRLGIKHHFTASATLAEIYAKVKNKSTLIHDVD